MTSSFWLNYIGALVVVALMLGGLYAVVQGLRRGRVLTSASHRIVTVLESTPLSQHSAMHVVKVGSKYLLIGASNGHVSTLGEMDAPEIEAWLAEQRTMLGKQPASLLEAFNRLRGKST